MTFTTKQCTDCKKHQPACETIASISCNWNTASLHVTKNPNVICEECNGANKVEAVDMWVTCMVQVMIAIIKCTCSRVQNLMFWLHGSPLIITDVQWFRFRSSEQCLNPTKPSQHLSKGSVFKTTICLVLITWREGHVKHMLWWGWSGSFLWPLLYYIDNISFITRGPVQDWSDLANLKPSLTPRLLCWLQSIPRF